MKLLTRGRQVTQAVKNVGRLRQILTTFGRHGLQTFLVRMGLERYSGAESQAEGVETLTIPERLRISFEALGPTFVKLGQLLSNRPDMIPDEFIEEFKKLQDNVSPLSFDVIRKQVESELGGKLEDHFDYFGEKPLASASIGQVHEATLKTGEEVVVKVQRPGISELIKSDVSILTFLAKLMEKYLPETRMLAPTQIVDEFFRTLSYELNYIVEANTTVKVAENFRDSPRVVIPRVYRSMTTQKILTLERLHGVRITDADDLHTQRINPRELVDIGARAFFKMVLIDGLFHGDLHGGNLFAMKHPVTGESQIGVIDFGIVGRLSEKSRDAFSRMVLALLTEDYESLCYEYADLAAYGSGIDFEKFQSEVRNALSPYMGLSLKEVQIGKVLIDATRIAVKYNIKIPSEWMIVFKAVFTLEGMGRQLDPDFDLLSIGNELIRSALRERYSLQRLGKDAAWVLRDLSALLQTTPRQIRWMFRKFNSNDFAFEVKFKEAELLRRQLERGYRGVGLSIISGSLFIAAALSLQIVRGPMLFEIYPVHAAVLFSLGAIGFAGLVFKRWR